MKRAKHPPGKPRNPLAALPLLRKGGAHGKSNAALRRAANAALRMQSRQPEAEE
jgi:hypothetical protein